MKRLILASTFLALLWSSGPAWSGLFKCTNDKGHVTYQQTPCADEAKNEAEIAVTASTAKKPFPTTEENKKYFRYYTIHTNQKVIVDACAARNSPYAEDIAQAHQRFYEIGEENVERGREIAETGLQGLPASEIRQIQRESKAEKKIELRQMSMDKLNRLCSSHARKLRSLAAQIPNRSSGYEEGDLDPEGND